MKKVDLTVKGMHCASCEVLIERKLANVHGIRNVKVSRTKETAEVEYEGDVRLEDLQKEIEADGYTLTPKEAIQPVIGQLITSKRRWAEIGAVAIIIFGLYLLFKQLNVLPDIGITDNMSYGVIFLIGLVAATSTCLAVAGGLLLAVAARYNETNPSLSGRQKFMPHIYFNLGRIVSYTILGGLVGILGSMLTLSSTVTGILTIAASVLMVLVGIQLLDIFPWTNKFSLKMPKFIAHKIHDASQNPRKGAAYSFLFGGSTFFLPCGFTQALQLYVLSKGSFTIGALTMLAFSLGTLPSLAGIGAFSSFARGNLKRHFITFSAVLVIILGLFNLPNGLTLVGASIASPSFQGAVPDVPQLQNAQLVDGKQVIELKVDYLDYYPTSFTVFQGVPVEWRIDGRTAAGCAQVISVPKLGVTEYLPKNEVKIIQFTPKDVGQIKFSCSMGMAGPGFINVVANPNGGTPPVSGATILEPAAEQQISPTDVQKLTMEVSRERGFYPNSFTVQKGIPVELEIDTKVQLGGCMSTLIIPEYNVAQFLKLGKSVLKFTPTKSGTVPFTCSMGSKMGQFIVV